MAYGKNKGLQKGGKKGAKKKVAHPFTKKNWYDIKAPTYFTGKNRKAGLTVVSKTAGTRIETDGLKGRVCEFNLADLQDSGNDDGHKKIKLEVMEIQGRSCLTDFHSMEFTRDKMCALIKKKHSLIESFADCKTTDGYVIRLFALGLSARHEGQTKRFCYMQSSQAKRCRKKMAEVMIAQVAGGQLRDCVKALNSGKIEIQIKHETQRIFPLEPVHIYKAKLIKKPKLDVTKLMEIHNKGDEEGVAVTKDEEAESKNLLAN